MAKSLVKTAVLLLILVGASPSFAGQGAKGDSAPEASATLSTTSATPPAVSLKKSLTAQQQQALTGVLDRFKDQLTDIGNQLAGTIGHGALNASGSAASDTQARAAFDKLKAVQAQIDNETASILSRRQIALHEQALAANVAATDLASAVAFASANDSKALTSGAFTEGSETPSFTSSYCSTGSLYAARGRYYAYYAYLYAYYNYVYYDTDSYAYYAYLYLNYAQSYALSALKELAGGYFDNVQLSSDFNGLGSAGVTDAYYAYYYAYYGYVNAYNNYYYSGGSSYAYWAYYYGYYAYGDLVNAHSYGAYCH